MGRVALFVLIGVTYCLTGCYSLDSSFSKVTGEEHVLVSNYGWSIFNCIPICCGNCEPEETRLLPWAFFRNDVTQEKLQAKLADYADKRGRELSEIVCHSFDTMLFNVPMTTVPIPLPYIICYRELQISGVLK